MYSFYLRFFRVSYFEGHKLRRKLFSVLWAAMGKNIQNLPDNPLFHPIYVLQ